MSDLKRVAVDGQRNVFTKALIFRAEANTSTMWIWSKSTPIYVYFDDGARKWSTTEKSNFMAAVKTWEAVSGLRFAVTTSKTKADFIEHKVGNAELGKDTLGEHGNTEMAAIGFFDGALELGGNGQAHGYYNADDPKWLSGLKKGGLSYNTVIHEIGHALNLAHPHDRGGFSGLFPGVTEDDISDLGNFNFCHNIYSIMSYNGGYTFGAGGKIVLNTATSPPKALSHVATPGPFDIAAIQALYGSRASAAGNTTYKLSDSNGPWLTIWDTGGKDTITYSGSHKAYIDLEPASLKAAADGGGGLNYVANVYKGFTIGPGVWIENATTGKGNDVIHGNDRANILDGGAGNDTILGGKGNDTIHGGDGRDLIDGGSGRDRLEGGGGRDTFDYNAVSDTGATSGTRDRISDFTHGVDLIDLKSMDANGSSTGNGTFAFAHLDGTDFSGTRGELIWYHLSTASTIIEGDVDGNGKADFQIELTGYKSLLASDFVL